MSTSLVLLCSLLVTLHQPFPAAASCPNLSKALLQQHGKDNTIMVTSADTAVMATMGLSWVENVKAAGITYWLVSAEDHGASQQAARMAAGHCFLSPLLQDASLAGHPEPGSSSLKAVVLDGEKYLWGAPRWRAATWRKVRIVAAIHRMGFHVLHSDLDVTWYQDPLPFFLSQLSDATDLLISTDALGTFNNPGERGVERRLSTTTTANTGIYFLRQNPRGSALMDLWLSWSNVSSMHDQDALNSIIRGSVLGDRSLPQGWADEDDDSVMRPALMTHAGVRYLPVSSFANAYTFVTARLHELYNHTLYEVHWVWGGSSLEAKRHTMRDAAKYHDPAPYYAEPHLVSIEMDYPQLPLGYNDLGPADVENMTQFHIASAGMQLQQLYYGFAIAMALGRSVVLPRMLCFCAKNWYRTYACRINELATRFPFTCSLSQLLRPKRLAGGLTVDAGGSNGGGGSDRSGDPTRRRLGSERNPDHLAAAGRIGKELGAQAASLAPVVRRVEVREYSFLENPRTSEAIKISRMVVSPAGVGQDANIMATLADGTPHLVLRAGLSEEELVTALRPHAFRRVLHFRQPALLFSAFASPVFHTRFDAELSRMTTYWCCRPEEDLAKHNHSRIQLDILPPARRRLLQECRAQQRSGGTAAGGGGGANGGASVGPPHCAGLQHLQPP